MTAWNFPGLEEHRLLHKEFRYRLADVLERARTMTLDQIAEHVRRLVNGWLSQHIVTVDMEFVPHVRETKA